IRLTARQGVPISPGSTPAPPPVVASTPPSGGQFRPIDRPSPQKVELTQPSSTTSDTSSVVKRPPPVIAIASPSETQQVTTDRVQLLGAAASDSGVARIELRVNGQLVKQQENRGGTRTGNVDFAESLALREGKNEITVTVVDLDNLA